MVIFETIDLFRSEHAGQLPDEAMLRVAGKYTDAVNDLLEYVSFRRSPKGTEKIGSFALINESQVNSVSTIIANGLFFNPANTWFFRSMIASYDKNKPVKEKLLEYLVNRIRNYANNYEAQAGKKGGSYRAAKKETRSLNEVIESEDGKGTEAIELQKDETAVAPILGPAWNEVVNQILNDWSNQPESDKRNTYAKILNEWMYADENKLNADRAAKNLGFTPKKFRFALPRAQAAFSSE